METLPYWKRPERWLAFVLTLLGVCSLLAIIQVDPGSDAAAELPGIGLYEEQGFLNNLRTGSSTLQAPGHWTSLLPPIMAIAVAAYFRSMIFALLAAFLAGSFLSFGVNPLATILLGLHDFVFAQLLSQFSLYIFLFLFALVGMVHLLSRNGGLAGLVEALGRLAKGRRRASTTIGLAGLVMFFDDYSSTVVVGTTMQKLSDKWKLSREKLAYLVDSTAAPVAGLVVLSTWIAFEAMLIGEQARNLGIEESGYSIFASIIPLRFYCLGALIFLFMSSAMGRDFGPMLRAEKRALESGKVIGDDHRKMGIQPSASIAPPDAAPHRWINAVIPIAVIILGILIGILLVGGARVRAMGDLFSFVSFADWRKAFGAAVFNPLDESGPGVMPILFGASVLAGLVAIALTLKQRILTIRQCAQAYVKGMPTMWMAIYILVMTWGMQAICERLDTADYLVALLGDDIPLWALPLFTFIVASGMSFAIGSSWGAMGILIPIMLPLAHEMGAYQQGDQIIFLLTVAAILDGAIFGDHCSPISDTTVLTSISTGCDHIAHVHTQILYAVTTMAMSGIFGYIAVSRGMPLWVFYLCFPLATLALLLFAGRRPQMATS